MGYVNITLYLHYYLSYIYTIHLIYLRRRKPPLFYS